jgi:hypothetical protein
VLDQVVAHRVVHLQPHRTTPVSQQASTTSINDKQISRNASNRQMRSKTIKFTLEYRQKANTIICHQKQIKRQLLQSSIAIQYFT